MAGQLCGGENCHLSRNATQLRHRVVAWNVEFFYVPLLYLFDGALLDQQYNEPSINWCQLFTKKWNFLLKPKSFIKEHQSI